MDKATYDRGLQIRKSVLGNEFVDKGDRIGRRLQSSDAGPHDGILAGATSGAAMA